MRLSTRRGVAVTDNEMVVRKRDGALGVRGACAAGVLFERAQRFGAAASVSRDMRGLGLVPNFSGRCARAKSLSRRKKLAYRSCDRGTAHRAA